MSTAIFLSGFVLVQACVTERPKPPTNTLRNESSMVLIKGGKFAMGTDEGMPFEAPVHEVDLGPFLIDAHEVSVAEFAKFIEATGYQTEADKFGWSGVFSMSTKAWMKVDGANWRYPEGPNAKPAVPNEPVTQVSWNDTVAYAKWVGKRLPTEAEWEFAARGGLVGKTYAWGDELRPGGKPVANWWQGEFPDNNTDEDGYRMRAPVGSFAPNGYGLYDVAGNVWEWVADHYDPSYYPASPTRDPKGPPHGKERVIRGGSWMCAENFCANYRVAARSHSAPDTGLNNLGFRLAKDIAR